MACLVIDFIFCNMVEFFSANLPLVVLWLMVDVFTSYGEQERCLSSTIKFLPWVIFFTDRASRFCVLH